MTCSCCGHRDTTDNHVDIVEVRTNGIMSQSLTRLCETCRRVAMEAFQRSIAPGSRLPSRERDPSALRLGGAYR